MRRDEWSTQEDRNCEFTLNVSATESMREPLRRVYTADEGEEDPEEEASARGEAGITPADALEEEDEAEDGEGGGSFRGDAPTALAEEVRFDRGLGEGWPPALACARADPSTPERGELEAAEPEAALAQFPELDKGWELAASSCSWANNEATNVSVLEQQTCRKLRS